MIAANNLQEPLLQGNGNSYGTSVITIPPKTPKNTMRVIVEYTPLIVKICEFLSGDEYKQFEKIYNDFYQRKMVRFQNIGFGLEVARHSFFGKSYEMFLYNKLTPEDRLLRAKAIADSPPTKHLIDAFHTIEEQCRKIFEIGEINPSDEKILSLIGRLTPHGGEYKANVDLYTTLMLKQLREIIPSKSVAEFTASETEQSDRLSKMLDTFLPYLIELKDLQEANSGLQNLATCLALIIQIKRNVSGLQDRHIADLKTVSDTLIATGFPALALEILNPLALFEDPQHITLSSFKNIFDQWSETSLAYLKKYPDEENIELMFARLNEMGKQVLTYGYPTNSSLINNTTTHLCQIMQEIHTLSEHKKLLSGNEAKILTGRLQKLNSFGRLNRFDLMQFSPKARLIIFAIGTIIWWGSIALAIWGGANLANYYNLNLPVSIFLSSIASIFMLAAPFLIHHRYFSIKHRLVTQLTTTW